MGQQETVFRTDAWGRGLFSDLLVKQLSTEQETAKSKVSETEWAAVTHPSTLGGWRAVAFCKRFRLFNRWKIVLTRNWNMFS